MIMQGRTLLPHYWKRNDCESVSPDAACKMAVDLDRCTFPNFSAVFLNPRTCMTYTLQIILVATA